MVNFLKDAQQFCKSKTGKKKQQPKKDIFSAHDDTQTPETQETNEGGKATGFISNFKQKLSKPKKPKSTGPPRPEPHPAPQSFASASTFTSRNTGSTSSSSRAQPCTVMNPFMDWQDTPESEWTNQDCRDWITLYCCHYLEFSEDKAVDVALSYSGNGSTLYKLSVKDWTHLMSSESAAFLLVNRLKLVTHDPEALPEDSLTVRSALRWIEEV